MIFRHFRRRVLAALQSDLRAELEFVAGITRENIKTYQAWFGLCKYDHLTYIRYHRRHVASLVGEGESELVFTAEILKQDAKNYHAWQHR